MRGADAVGYGARDSPYGEAPLGRHVKEIRYWLQMCEERVLQAQRHARANDPDAGDASKQAAPRGCPGTVYERGVPGRGAEGRHSPGGYVLKGLLVGG